MAVDTAAGAVDHHTRILAAAEEDHSRNLEEDYLVISRDSKTEEEDIRIALLRRRCTTVVTLTGVV